MRKRAPLVAALVIAVAGLLAWLALGQRDRRLTMQEQLALGHDPEWVVLDTDVPEIAAAGRQAKTSLPEFIARVPRYNASLEGSMSGIFAGGDEMEEARKRWADDRLDAPEGPKFAVRACLGGMPIPGAGLAFPHVWLPHARYDEREDIFWCLLPENPPPWFEAWPGCTGIGVPSEHVLDWRIISDGRVEGAYTTRALKGYLEQQQP